jgi:hypothetical protein
MRIRISASSAIALICLLVFAGCGSSASDHIPAGPKGTVSGKVFINDKPAPAGTTVVFTHSKVGVPATGLVAPDGSYSLEMIDTMQIPTGLYKITVYPPAQQQMSEAEYEQYMSGEGKVSELQVSNQIPHQYLRTETSPLKYEVKEGANTFDVKITK